MVLSIEYVSILYLSIYFRSIWDLKFASLLLVDFIETRFNSKHSMYFSVVIFFKKMARSRPLNVYFRLLHMTQFKYKLIKVLMVHMLVTRTRVGRIEGKDEKMSYGGTPPFCCYSVQRNPHLLWKGKYHCLTCFKRIKKCSSRCCTLVASDTTGPRFKSSYWRE